ncbi:hypothetical protein [Saccharicrinis sp. GN24d3]|uniref:hypothetical protein n=1 Tax=Saccharicrinis sp. GN24d3 TaxID=3458416 RepID=UPI0040368DB1
MPVFKKVLQKPETQVELRGKSKSTLQNYGRRLALFVIHFKALPELKRDTKLPVILNRSGLKAFFRTPLLLKQRTVLTRIYSAGLHGKEVINSKLEIWILNGRPSISDRASIKKTGLCHSPRLWPLG